MEDGDESSAADPPAPGGSEGQIDAIAPIVAEAAGRVVALLRTQGRTRIEEAARWTRRRVELHQASKDIDTLYQKLGRELVCLVEAGEVDHPGLVKRAARIRDEEARHEAARSAGETLDHEEQGEE